ncbi:MAG: hypothetical protein SVV03_00145 [Candidatus Nanohaloarchaea archaeon]|nr:hypothetical protein [Candidatus Nanohaloarchaea archaeon]
MAEDKNHEDGWKEYMTFSGVADYFTGYRMVRDLNDILYEKKEGYRPEETTSLDWRSCSSFGVTAVELFASIQDPSHAGDYVFWTETALRPILRASFHAVDAYLEPYLEDNLTESIEDLEEEFRDRE